MLKGFKISVPFFEIGPKAYLYGEKSLRLAADAEAASKEYSVAVIYTPQVTELWPVARANPSLYLCAQHMDALRPGRGLGAILPEAVAAAGAKGVMLNHAEKPLPLPVLKETILRAAEVGLFTIVCADSIAEAKAVALLGPDIVVAEPSELIGSGKASTMDYVKASIDAVKSVDERIYVLQGAGITTPDDVYNVIAAGADATGSSGAICRAENPGALAREMLAAASAAAASRR